MPNPKKKIDCIILADTYSLLDFSTPLELAREVAGGKFTTPEYVMMLGEGIEKTNNKFDISGEYGEYIVYPGAFGFNMREKCLANSEEQKNLYKKHSKILVNELDELAASENLKDYPALKGFVEYRNKFLKAAIEGTDRLAVLAETPGGYSLRASPDWTQNKKGHEKNAKQFNDMFIGMKYDKLFAITDEYIDLELEMRNKVLTPEKLKECKDKRIDQNNRMIKIYEHQKAPESKEKYWEFFQNYDDTIGGPRGVSETIRQLKSHNQALENGWDVSRLYMFSHMEEIATDCRKAQETFAHFNDPNLDKVSVYSKKVAKLDPTNRNFENMEQFDKYMTEFHLAFTDLINEVSKPEVHEALSNVGSTITLKTFEYNQSMAKRQSEIQTHKSDPSYSAPPEPKKPDVYNLESGFFHDFGSDVNGIVFRRLREFAKCVDPEYYDLEGDKKAVEQRKTEIATAKAPLMAKKGREITAGSNLNKLLEVNKKKTDEVAKAQEYIDCTLKASKLASEKLKALPPINTFPKEILTEEFKGICKNYNKSLNKVARIRNTSRIIINATNGEIKKLAQSSQALRDELEKNKEKFSGEIDKDKAEFIEEFRKSIADSTDKFTANFFEAREKSKDYAENQDMTAYIDNKKHEISCVEARMNADFEKEWIYDTKEKKQIQKIMNDLNSDIQRSNEANKVFIHHHDYDDAVRAMNTLAVDLKKYQDFIRNKNSSDQKTEREILVDTEKKAMALRESADEAARKMEAYLERKGKQGPLNEKGQRRVEVFKKALETTKKIGHICDDRLTETNTKIISIDNAEILKKDVEAVNKKMSTYEDAVGKGSLPFIERVSAQGALLGIQGLKELAFANRKLNEEEMNMAKEDIALIVIFENKLFNTKSNPTVDEYTEQASLLANDPSFGKAVDLSPVGIRDFIAAKDITEKASNIYGRFMNDKDREKKPRLLSRRMSTTSWKTIKNAISKTTAP